MDQVFGHDLGIVDAPLFGGAGGAIVVCLALQKVSYFLVLPYLLFVCVATTAKDAIGPDCCLKKSEVNNIYCSLMLSISKEKRSAFLFPIKRDSWLK